MRARGERLRGRALASSAEARHYLDAAVSAFVRLEMPFEAARTRLQLAQALREYAPEVAEAEARAALVAFENLGAKGDAGTAAALLREIGNGTGKQINGVSGLSPRETEVLRLVAHGMSNKEIADRLALSKHTVHRHVSSILTKLHLPSRTAAAAFAVRHGLL
jgi:DNA-binding NarL/FixJ family response regulator